MPLISKGYSVFIKQQSKYLLKAWSNSSVHSTGPIQCTVTYFFASESVRSLFPWNSVHFYK